MKSVSKIEVITDVTPAASSALQPEAESAFQLLRVAVRR